MKPDLSSGNDRLAQLAQDAQIDRRSGARPHGQTFGLGQRLEIGFDPGFRRLFQERMDLRHDALHALHLGAHILAAEHRYRRAEIGKFIGGYHGKSGHGAPRQPPTLGDLTGIGLLNMGEQPLDRVPQPFRRSPAERLIGIASPDVFQRQS